MGGGVASECSSVVKVWEVERGVVVVETAVTSSMDVLVVGQRDECVRDDDEACG